MKRVGVVLLAVVVCLAAAAQEKKAGAKAPAKHGAKKAGTAAASQGMMPAIKPSPEMEKAKWMVGVWRATEKHQAMEMMPAGGSTGTDVVKLGPGGLSIVSDYRSKGDMGPFVGHGVLWWDDKQKAYKGIWCDSMSPSGCETDSTGRWEGDKLVFTVHGEMMGKRVETKETYTDIKPGSFTLNFETSTDGGPMKPAMSIHFVRGAKEKAKETAAQ